MSKRKKEEKKPAFRCVEEVMEEEEDSATGKNRKVMGAGWVGGVKGKGPGELRDE